MDGDRFDALAKAAANSSTRRAVVAAAAKLAYAAPLVVATAAVTTAEAGAATTCACPAGTTEVTKKCPTRGKCAKCRTGYLYDRRLNVCKKGATKRTPTFSAKVCTTTTGQGGPALSQ